MWFAIDSLEFLRRSGRIGAASAWVGSTLRVKPILTIEDGQMTPVERVRTTERAFERLVDYARQRHASGADAWVVQHVRSPELADRLTDRAREVFGNCSAERISSKNASRSTSSSCTRRPSPNSTYCWSMVSPFASASCLGR
jgi:DegV family protein with EDD domain